MADKGGKKRKKSESMTPEEKRGWHYRILKKEMDLDPTRKKKEKESLKGGQKGRAAPDPTRVVWEIEPVGRERSSGIKEGKDGEARKLTNTISRVH